MSVFYKFKSALTSDTIQFDDLHISLQDFKKAVIQRSQPGKNTNFDLQVTNAETNEVYSDENSLIPKNSSLIVVRVPLSGVQKKAWDIGDHLSSKIGVLSSDYMQETPGNIVVKSADLAALNASEEDKIKAMMFQSNVDYDPINRVKGGNQLGDPPPAYICHKCHHPGHWIKDCPITVVPDIKKSSGIPQSFMTPVEDPSVPGALMTPTGTFAVPTIDMQAYKEGKKEKPFIPSEETEESSKPIIPEDLVCTLCQDLLTDAVMMPCCGNSFCDECIRNILIESEENQCPDCKEKDTSPETLIPNRFLRNAVNNFRNKSGYKGGGHRVKRKEPEPSKSPTIEQDQDIEIIGTIAAEPVKKIELEVEKEKGSAIVVLGSAAPQRINRMPPTNGTQKLPTIHVEHRPPLGRPKMPADGLVNDSLRPVGNGVRSSPDTEAERKKSSPVMKTSLPHPTPVVNRLPIQPHNLPNTSQLPPGYNPSTLPPLNTHYGGNVPPIIPGYGPLGGVSAMAIPSHIAGQPGPVRLFPAFSNQNLYGSQIGGYRNAPSHHRMRPHHSNTYAERPVVEDPLEAFQRHLQERERQDRLRRTRGRRSRSRSPVRLKSRSRSRQRSRSRSVSKKRTHSNSPPMRKESPLLKRNSRSPVLRRSKSKSRSRTRLRSRSIPRNSMTRSKSPSPMSASKKKRNDSLSPNVVAFKKRSRSTTPTMKKSSRGHRSRSRSRSRTRSKSINRTRKKRRSRSRSRSISSRSISRGRSYSRSPSPRTRAFFSPSHSHRGRRSSRSPSRHQYSHSRHRGSNYREPSPYHNSSNYYEVNEHRIFRRGGRGSRYQRGAGRYQPAGQMYDSGPKFDRYAHSDRFDDKRYNDTNNSRGYFPPNESSRSRRDGGYQPPAVEYDQQQFYGHFGGEVAPPGTTDVHSVNYATLPFNENVPTYHERVDRYRRSAEYEDRNAPPAGGAKTASYKEPLPVLEEWKKSSRDYDRDKERRRSRERHHGHHSSHNNDADRNKRHGSRSSRVTSQSPTSHRASGDRKRRSRGRSVDKENRGSRAERAASNRRDASVDRDRDEHALASKLEHHQQQQPSSSENEKTRLNADERSKDEYKEKKEKSKRKKKKESDVEKKKRKKLKTSKKEEEPAKQLDETVSSAREDGLSDGCNEDEGKTSIVDQRNDSLYGDIEDTKVDVKIIETYGKLENAITDKPTGGAGRDENVIMAPVPELSKWEREDVSSPSDDHRTTASRMPDDKKIVTSEILKRAENVLFHQKSSAKSSSSRAETKSEVSAVKEKDDIQLLENAREARKSGNSIQVTVAAVNSKSSEDDGRSASAVSGGGRISAKDRLGAKVEDKNYATVRSLVEPKIKPRSIPSTVKAVVDVKHSSKLDAAEKHDKERRHESTSRKMDEKRRKDSRHSDMKVSKHRDSKEKGSSKRDENHHSKKEKEKSKSKDDVSEGEKENVEAAVLDKSAENSDSKSINDVKSILEKKRPCLDEASFEPDYDLTSESDVDKEPERKVAAESEESSRKPAVVDTKVVSERATTPKTAEQPNEPSSSESSSETSSGTSTERKKRSKKRKSKKRRKVKKRKTYSSDSESEESSESDSDSDAKSKRKRRHRHKTKKSSRSAKKKKRTKHR